jgi:uncharacterized protein
MKIALDSIPQTGMEIVLSGQEPILADPLARMTPLTDVEIAPTLMGRLALTLSDEDVFVSGRVEGSLSLKCSRCLAEFRLNVGVELNLALRRSGEDAGISREREEDEDAIFIDQDAINIGEIILQELLTEIPIKPLCRDGCPGLCPRCGALKGSDECKCPAQEAIDPRWAALAKLKDKIPR